MVVRASDPGATPARQPRGWTLHSLPADEAGPVESAGELGSPDISTDLCGRLIGARFDLEELLSHGALGSVYLARDRNYLRSVDLKISADTGAWAIERIRRRTRRMMTVRHPHVAAVHGEGMTEGGLHYVALEHVDGRNVHHVHGDPRFAGPGLPAVAVQIAEALVALHAAGVVHGAVTPDNLVCVEDPETPVHIKLTDLDVRASGAAADSDLGLGMQTDASAYLPSGAQPDQLDERADLYGLAAVLYELASGRHPPAESVPSLLESAPDVPPWFDALLLAALARESSPTTASAAAFLDALRAGMAAPPPPKNDEDRWFADLAAHLTPGTGGESSTAPVKPDAGKPRPSVVLAPSSMETPPPPRPATLPPVTGPAQPASRPATLPPVTGPAAPAGATAPSPSASTPATLPPRPALVLFPTVRPETGPIPAAASAAAAASVAPAPARPAVLPAEVATAATVKPVTDAHPSLGDSLSNLYTPTRIPVRLVVAAILAVAVALAIWRLRSGPTVEAPAPTPIPAPAQPAPAPVPVASHLSPGTVTLARTADPPRSGTPEPDEPAATPSTTAADTSAAIAGASLPTPIEPTSEDAAAPALAPGELPEQLSAGEFRKILLRANRTAAVGECYKKFSSGPDRGYPMVAMIAATGRVQKLRMEPTPLGDCLRKVVVRLDFPAATRQAQHNYVFHDPRSSG